MEYWDNRSGLTLSGQEFQSMEDLEEACFEDPELVEAYEQLCYLREVKDDIDTYFEQEVMQDDE